MKEETSWRANSRFASPHHLQTVVTMSSVFMIVITMQPWPLKGVCRGGRRAMGECLRKPLRITLQPSWLNVILHLRPGQLATLIGSLLFHFQEQLRRLIRMWSDASCGVAASVPRGE